jgi:hypothetical protein
MEASKERSGSKHLGTLETGMTIARKDLGYSSFRMEISTKECGSKTGDMDKERIGGMKVEN